MGNVKVRKTRHLRGGGSNPFPTAEEVLAQVATGVIVGLSQRAIQKARQAFGAAARNRKASKRVKPDAVPTSEVAAPVTAKKTAKKSKTARKPV